MKWIAFPFLALVLVACASTPQTHDRQERPSLPYEVRVLSSGPAEVTNDGFEAHFEFEVISPFELGRNALVQELTQTITFEHDDGSTRERRLALVEAFRLRFTHRDGTQRFHYRIEPGQVDRHSMRLDRLGDEVLAVYIDREIFAYVANVHGAQFTPLGFAHLPRNEDGTVVSEIPARFNESYQRDYETTGYLNNSGDALGLVYRIRYRLVRNGDAGPMFIVDRARGMGEVEEPTVLGGR